MSQGSGRAAFFQATQTSGKSARSGQIKFKNGCTVSTPALLIRTSRFLPAHLTPDNLDRCIPAGSSILEMNLDFLVENEVVMSRSPLPLSKLAASDRPVCLSVRQPSASEPCRKGVINGEAFVTVLSSAGFSKFPLASLADVLKRFEPDMVISPHDDHVTPVSLKRVKKSVNRTLGYHRASVQAAEALGIPVVASVVGAEHDAEKKRQLEEMSAAFSGLAWCDFESVSLEKRIEMLDLLSESVPMATLRVYRGPVSPLEMTRLLPYVDVFDTSYVDDLVSRGMALQLSLSSAKDLSLVAQTEPINLWDEAYFSDQLPLLAECSCPSCARYSRAYVHHLLKSHEMLGEVLLMMHNLHQYDRWLKLLKQD